MRTITRNYLRGAVKKSNLAHLFLTALCCISTLVFSSPVFGQSLPSATSCTSKDLELVDALLTGGDACNSCTSGLQTRNLIGRINNKTGSTRTSFAIWATLVVTHSDGSTNTTPNFFRCGGPVPPTGPLPAYYEVNFGTIQYQCGDVLTLTNLFLAWTDAATNTKNTCPYIQANPDKISPKCGTLPSLRINSGVNATITSQDASCSGGGSITVSPFGGPASNLAYTVTLYKSVNGSYTQVGNSVTVNPNGSTTFSSLALGDYKVNITDGSQFHCSVDKTRSITQPESVNAPSVTVTQPTCSTAKGKCVVTAPLGTGITYSIDGTNYQPGITFDNLNPGNYTITAKLGGCTSGGTAKTINNPPVSPTFTVCITQPTLCDKGSLTITASNGTGFQYSIDGNDFSNTTGVFNNLTTGSVTNVQVKNSAGCSSALVACKDLSSVCGGGITNKDKQIFTSELNTDAPAVKAYPNPFNDKVKFVVNSPGAGNGSLEIYNMMGQKIKTVYQGRINSGNQSFELTIPKKQQSTLIYIFKVGDRQVTGKLLQLNN